MIKRAGPAVSRGLHPSPRILTAGPAPLFDERIDILKAPFTTKDTERLERWGVNGTRLFVSQEGPNDFTVRGCGREYQLRKAELPDLLNCIAEILKLRFDVT